jgi:hypothetical protein
MCRSGATFTNKKKGVFLTRLAECANITDACRAADIPRRTAYNAKAADEKFAASWQEAIDTYIDDRLEAEADRRAVEGVRKKKFTKNGEPIMDTETGKQYEEREYSDTLLIFRLKALRPDVYREKSSVDVTSNGKQISFVEVVATVK